MLLAILGPALIFAVTLVLIDRYEDPDEQERQSRAGAVINGKTLGPNIGTVGRYIDQRMRRRPQVVILGNSLANADVHPAALAREIGVPVDQAELFSIPNSNSGHWYAILKNRVFGAGYRPDLVIVLADLRSVLSVNPASQTSLLDLRHHLTDDDEEVLALLGEREGWAQDVLANRTQLRSRFLTTARNLAADLLYYRRPPQRADVHHNTALSLSKALDGARVDLGLHRHVLGRMIGNGVDGVGAVEVPPPVEQTFLPMLSALVAENGSQLVVVRPPFSAAVPDYLADEVAQVEKDKVRSLLNAAGNRLLDMRGVFMGRGHYADAVHMTDEGKRRFTRLIGLVLRERRIAGPPRPSGVPLLDPVDARTDDIGWVRPAVVAAAAPPSIANAPLDVVEAPRRMGAAQVPWLSNLSDASTVVRTEYLARCSPIRVMEDGTPLSGPNASCTEVFLHGRGRYCHMAERLLLAASDATKPYHNGRTYTMALADERDCDGGAWLYPGDRVRVAIDASRFAGSQGPWDAVWISAASLTRAAAVQPLELWLEAEDGRRVGGVVPLADLASGRAIVPLDPPLTTLPRVVEVSNPNRGFFLLLDLHLTTADTLPPPRRGRPPREPGGDGADADDAPTEEAE